MKTSILFFIGLIFIISTSCENTPSIKIKGDLGINDLKKIYLKDLNYGQEVTIDSANVKNGHFVIKHTIGENKLCGIFKNSGYSGKPIAKFYLEKVDINIELDKESTRRYYIKGGKLQDIYNNYNIIDQKHKRDLEKQINKINTSSKNKNLTLEEKQELDNSFLKLMKDIKNEKITFFKNHLSSIVAANIFIETYSMLEPNEAIIIAKSFKGDSRSHQIIKNILKTLTNELACKPGSLAPDFTLKNQEGKAVSLSSFRGKLVLLVFGASWCKPGRMECPNLVNNYNKFHKKGFEILNVSIDKNREKWISYINSDGRIWHNVIDTKEWESLVLKKYKTSSIPRNFLIDRDGIIIECDVRGPFLEEKLKEHFAN